MEIKKAPHADLERGKGLNLLLGLVVALSVLFTALEWRSLAQVEHSARDTSQDVLENTVQLEELKQEEEPEPEQVEQPQQELVVELPETFNVVDNNVEVAQTSFISDPNDNRTSTPPPAPVAPEPVQEEADEIFQVVEQAPEFPGGQSELMKYLSSSIRYPEIAVENGIQGRVIVQFVVEKDGSATQVEVARGVDPSLDKEAIRVVKEMPKWKPGQQRGKPVRTKFTLPVQFRLQ